MQTTNANHDCKKKQLAKLHEQLQKDEAARGKHRPHRSTGLPVTKGVGSAGLPIIRKHRKHTKNKKQQHGWVYIYIYTYIFYSHLYLYIFI